MLNVKGKGEMSAYRLLSRKGAAAAKA
jgi:hypothetical protein